MKLSGGCQALSGLSLSSGCEVCQAERMCVTFQACQVLSGLSGLSVVRRCQVLSGLSGAVRPIRPVSCQALSGAGRPVRRCQACQACQDEAGAQPPYHHNPNHYDPSHGRTLCTLTESCARLQ